MKESGDRTFAGDERGAVAVVVALMMVVLLGMAALAVDVGAMYVEKAQLQNGADASALAIANDCSRGTCGAVNGTGQFFADSNAGDATSGITSITFPTATSVRVRTNAREAGTGANHFSLAFARVLGFQNTQITATATASWGAPSGGSTLPWTIGQCVFRQSLSASQRTQLDSTGNFVGDPTPVHMLLRYDNNLDYPGCAGQNGDVRGGFGWLDRDGTGCSAAVNIGTGEAGSNPGLDFPGECSSIMARLREEPVLIPIYSSSVLNGSRATYTLRGFAALQITGYKFGGGPSVTHLDPAAPNCTGNCRGIQGFFTRFVSLDDGLVTSPTAPNLGASVVGLSN
ncbi:Tad domain-containing protein [Arthrobacter burdickii]|uniref:Tad domain-containing protein n=1 Tax=Arthrobacter burdickii TaxID=3035920 RepID=A0ABT8K0P3_9MICC|nr:Tad domain-containing protein [Arthrobacter burdickii]MDN4610767.1 Tad domain-containing protein [Arthrobacter burdickii]